LQAPLRRGEEQGGSGVAGIHDMHVRQQLPFRERLVDRFGHLRVGHHGIGGRIHDAAFGEIRRRSPTRPPSAAAASSRPTAGTRRRRHAPAVEWRKPSCPSASASSHAYHCGLVLGRDEAAALNLAALAALNTGTEVAGDPGPAKAEPKPRGADQKTRTTRRSCTATAGRAGGATLPHQRREETRDRTQAEALTDLPGRNARDAET
jgi:hypothetical protein